MRFLIFGLYFFVFVAKTGATGAAQIVMEKRAAVTISPVRLYADSSYAKATEVTFSEGELFEVFAESKNEHFDNTQNQTFKWFKVRSFDGKIGWIFGDNLAIVLPEPQVSYSIKRFFKKEVRFDNGFEKAVIWAASIEGHDENRDVSQLDYKEFYLVITNERGKCAILNYGNTSETVQKELQSIHFQDVTENNVDDIIIETSMLSKGRSCPERLLEIYSFKAGTLAKLFEERLTLAWESDTPSPAFSKMVEIDGETVRLAHVDYLACSKYTLGKITDAQNDPNERCLEYVTRSLRWDKTSKTLRPIYAESRSPLVGTVAQDVSLRETPSVFGALQRIIEPEEKFQIIKHFERLKVENGKKIVENWFFVKHESGSVGYVDAKFVVFKNTEYTHILQQYYTTPPLLKQLWQPKAQFVFLKK